MRYGKRIEPPVYPLGKMSVGATRGAADKASGRPPPRTLPLGIELSMTFGWSTVWRRVDVMALR